MFTNEQLVKPEAVFTDDELARAFIEKHPRYTTRAVMKIAGVAYQTALEWFTRGKLKGVKTGNGWTCSEEDLVAFLNGKDFSKDTEAEE